MSAASRIPPSFSAARRAASAPAETWNTSSRPASIRNLALLLVAAALAALAAASAAGGEETAPPRSRPAVVLELFTSQGCSSCPAADRVLSRLGGEARADGVTLVPLAYHVDYWNRIGWVDPFSSPRWSARQRRYADGFGLRSVYTPQIVLNGRAELVGSREGRVRAEIPGAVPPRPVGRVEILGAALDGTATELVVDLATEIQDTAPGPPLVASLALFESGLVTPVESGENSGRTLENDYVVRLLRPVITFSAAGPSSRSERSSIALDSGWAVENLGVALFLQDSETLEIHAAAVRWEVDGAAGRGSSRAKAAR